MENEIITHDGELLQAVTEDEYVMDVSEAKELTESIKSTSVALWVLIQRAHDKKAWKALNYNSWKDYIEGEFKFTRARSYQLLAQGSVITEISNAANSELYLTEKEAKIIKKELPKITRRLEDEVGHIDDEAERKEKAEEIIDGEIAHAMYNDKDTYDDGKDIDAMIEEDGGQSPDREFYSGQKGESNHSSEATTWGTPDDTSVQDADEANFYIENLDRTLSIMAALPNPEELANTMTKDSEETIKLRNRVKTAIKWLKSLEEAL